MKCTLTHNEVVAALKEAIADKTHYALGEIGDCYFEIENGKVDDIICVEFTANFA